MEDEIYTVVNPRPRHITKLALDQRFTDTEFKRIEDAASGIGVDTLQAVKIRRAMAQANKMGYADLDREDTRNYVLLMDALNLLDYVGRAEEILGSEIRDIERFVG